MPAFQRAAIAAFALSSACSPHDTVGSTPSAPAPSSSGSGSTADSALQKGPPITDAKELCSLLFGETKKKLESACSKGGAAEPAVDELRSAEERCLLLVGESLATRRSTVTRPQAEACAADIRMRWETYPAFARKMGTEALSLEVHPACAGLFQGTLGEGDECRSTLECRVPLFCPMSEERNHCVKPLELGQSCLGSAANQLAARTICGPDAFCGQPPLPTATGPAAIQEILQSQAAAYRKCYAAGLAKKPDLTGTVSIRLSIRKDGSVESASGQGSKLPDPTVIACIEKAIASLRFPASDATSSITYPISFASAGGARATASTAQPIDRAPAVPGAFVQSKGPVCVARAKKGDACAYTRGCADGLVCADNLCVDPPAATLSCRADRDCDLASRCRELATGRRCVPLRRNGESCESPEDCAGAACQKGVCTGPCGP